ncbi:MAG: NTP transferase domain-containing protein [Ignavibacteriae bacterium]|jgi:dTDP-glucose pyrophosphorylase|nr:NTP transferase domain-containing protein [Ignavibacteriota bacterium]
MKFDERINKLVISPEDSLINAMKLMDKLDSKLLLVMLDKKYIGIISIGDIQRAILKNISITEKIKNIIRSNIRVCYSTDNFDKIKSTMIEFRTEFMPILNSNDELEKIIFWSDIFEEQVESFRKKLTLPVVIMAGGLGKRLKPFTNIIPKPLIPMGEKPIIEIIMDKFNSIGSNEFYITVNYKREMLEYYLDRNMSQNYKINYVREDEPLGTAGSLYLLKDKIKSTFFVSNCDILINQDLRDVYQYHKSNNNELTAVGAILNKSIPYGIFETGNNGQLLNLTEKPEFSYLANTGVYILEHKLLDEIPIGKSFNITDLILNLLNQNRKVGIFPISEKSWSDIGEWKSFWDINLNKQ